MQKLADLSAELLQSAPNYEGLIKSQQSIQNSLESSERDTLKALRKTLEATLADPNSEACQKAVGRKMEVTYQSPFLVVSTAGETLQFVTDMKELFGMGYVKEMPSAVWEAFEVAKKYYKEHCILKQLASSINATENRMMECQKPMLAKEA